MKQPIPMGQANESGGVYGYDQPKRLVSASVVTPLAGRMGPARPDVLPAKRTGKLTMVHFWWDGVDIAMDVQSEDDLAIVDLLLARVRARVEAAKESAHTAGEKP